MAHALLNSMTALSVMRARTTQRKSKEQEIRPVMHEPFRILLADDVGEVANTIRLALGGSGYIFQSASDGQVALDLIKRTPDYFDLLITDDYMPNLRGLNLVRQLRNLNYGGKILVLSAYLTAEVKSAYTELKVDRILDKPFDINELRDAVDELAASRAQS
jgi:CheY-like chemotaxis protein